MKPPAGTPVEKIMALESGDFHRSVAVLAPGTSVSMEGVAIVPAGAGKRVTLRYEPLPGATLGKLLALPRARVTLAFEGMNEGERADFLIRFDRAFQRGGG